MTYDRFILSLHVIGTDIITLENNGKPFLDFVIKKGQIILIRCASYLGNMFSVLMSDGLTEIRFFAVKFLPSLVTFLIIFYNKLSGVLI